jgi:hypothetical protein
LRTKFSPFLIALLALFPSMGLRALSDQALGDLLRDCRIQAGDWQALFRQQGAPAWWVAYGTWNCHGSWDRVEPTAEELGSQEAGQLLLAWQWSRWDRAKLGQVLPQALWRSRSPAARQEVLDWVRLRPHSAFWLLKAQGRDCDEALWRAFLNDWNGLEYLFKELGGACPAQVKALGLSGKAPVPWDQRPPLEGFVKRVYRLKQQELVLACLRATARERRASQDLMDPMRSSQREDVTRRFDSSATCAAGPLGGSSAPWSWPAPSSSPSMT